MGEQTKSINEWIRNPDFTHVHLVCLPEELPVTESIELYRQLKSEFGITPSFYLNKISGLKQEDLSGLDDESSDALGAVIEMENTSREKLKAAEIKFFELPLVTLLNADDLILTIARKLDSLKRSV